MKHGSVVEIISQGIKYSKVLLSWGQIYHSITYGTAITVEESDPDFRNTTNTPYLDHMDELWGVYCEDFRENWPCDNGTTLWESSMTKAMLITPSAISRTCTLSCHLCQVTYYNSFEDWVPAAYMMKELLLHCFQTLHAALSKEMSENDLIFSSNESSQNLW